MNWSIIIFCYNEGGNLEKTVGQCYAFLKAHAAGYEILVVNDGSTDNTSEICTQLCKSVNNLRVITHKTNLGIGPALKTGYNNAQYEYVCAIPGDGQFNPEELTCVKPFDADTFYSFHRERNNYNIYRKILTKLNMLYNYVFLGLNMNDVNWIKVYKREQLELVQIKLNSSILESEICAKLMKCGVKPIEIPSLYRIRETGTPKGGSWKTLKKALSEMWLLYKTVSDFKKQPVPLRNIKTNNEKELLISPGINNGYSKRI